MFFILSKILSFLISPLNWVCILLIIGFLWKKWKIILSSLLVLLLFSNHFLYLTAVQAYEQAVADSYDPYKIYEVVIVLGGVSRYDDDNEMMDFNGNIERLLNVLPMVENGQVQHILFAGGSGSLVQDEKEANVIGDYLISIGIKEGALILEDESRNTYENAKYAAEIIKKRQLKPVLLVTSATHMYRSVKCFEAQGLFIDTYKVDYTEAEHRWSVDALLLPHPKVLDSWTALFHEWIGLIAYQMMGYI
jgi:uncharacterized SAM-binding protein YcdF (DUF218 family)